MDVADESAVTSHHLPPSSTVQCRPSCVCYLSISRYYCKLSFLPLANAVVEIRFCGKPKIILFLPHDVSRNPDLKFHAQYVCARIVVLRATDHHLCTQSPSHHI